MIFTLPPPVLWNAGQAGEFSLSPQTAATLNQTADPQRTSPLRRPAVHTAAARAQEESSLAWRDLGTQLFLIINAQLLGESESAPVTNRACLAAYALLSEANEHGFLTIGDLYPDGDGGLRVEWEQDERQLRLVIHPSDTRENYLYWQEGANYDIETPVSATLLVGWLRWLQKTVK